MSAIEERVARGELADVDPDDFTHYFCCDPNVALCGYVAEPDDPWTAWTDEPEADDCPACVAVHQIAPDRCGRRFCGIRGWWRRVITERRAAA